MRAYNDIKWWHKIDLGGGIITPGVADSNLKLLYTPLPDVRDKRVLDIGAWDGWWSFECEKRGAREVVALDRWPFTTGQDGFNYARAALGSKVIDIKGDIHDTTLLERLGTFDVIICLGVLHHLKSPLLSLKNIYDLCKPDGTLLLETHIGDTYMSYPLTEFYKPENAPYNDPTCLWGPNLECVEAWLKYVGFKQIKQVGFSSKTYANGGDRASFHAIK